MEKRYDVFISYSRKNMELADRVEHSLSSRGLHCFIDRETIEIGEDFNEKIGRSIYNSEVVLLLWTPESNQSSNVAKEIALADAYSKTIIPFQVGDFIPHYRLALMLALLNRADKRQGFSDEDLEKLTDRVIRTIVNSKEKATADNIPQTKTPPQRESTYVRQTNKEEQEFESEYLLGCEQFRKYKLDEAFELLLEPALADYKDAQRFLYYCITSSVRCRKIARHRFDDISAREDLARHGFALYIMGKYSLHVLNDYSATYSYAVKSMEAGSVYGTMLYILCYEFGYGVEKNFDKIMPVLRRLALKGNPLAQYRYGRHLIFGWSCTKNPQVGFRLIKEGADKGDLNCIYQLALLYQWGEVVPKDTKTAEEIYTRLVSMGWAEAYDDLGSMFCYDNGKVKDTKDVKIGYSYYMKGAELGEPGCMISLGNIYRFGVNGNTNINAAIRWMERAAKAGHKQAFFSLGYIYYYGESGIASNEAKAWEYFKEGAETYRSWDSYYMMGLMFYDGYAPVGITALDAVNYFKEAVYGGGAYAGEAACQLYDIYHEGKVVPQDDFKGIEYLEQAAGYESEIALLKLGKILTEDITSPYADEVKGIKYLTQAYEKGNVEAAIMLAVLCRKGIATIRDLEKSKEYLQFAIDKEENPKALCEMGKLFSHVRHPDWDEMFDDEDISDEQKNIDQQIAVEYLSRAAEKKYAEAFTCLFSIETERLYDDSDDSETSDRLFRWASGGAELDDPQAILDLGICHNLGIGTETNLPKAEELYLKAIEKGHKVAPSTLANLYMESFPQRMSDAYFYAMMSEARGYSSSTIEDLDKAFVKNAKEMERKGYFDPITFADSAIPRKINISFDSDYTMGDMCLMRTSPVSEISTSSEDLGNYLQERHPESLRRYFVPAPSEDTPLIRYIDRVRLLTAASWNYLRSDCCELQNVSFYSHEEILDTIENMMDPIIQSAAISVVNICLELDNLYSLINDTSK